MRIRVSKYSGFCIGVRKALEILDNIVCEGGRKAYTTGPIIHNPQVVEYYRQQGIESVENIADITEDATVVIRAHGIKPSDREVLFSKAVSVLDATCTVVQKAHEIIEEEINEGKFVYIAGNSAHPEVVVHLDLCRGRGKVLESFNDAVALERLESPAVLVAQTSFSDEEFQRIKDELCRRTPSILVHDTTCHIMRRAQESACKLACEVDMMLILGGHNSSNTRRLGEMCKAEGVLTHLIETADELRREWFDDVKEIGIAAGTSTPPDTIAAVKEWLRRELDAIEDEKEEN